LAYTNLKLANVIIHNRNARIVSLLIITPGVKKRRSGWGCRLLECPVILDYG